MFGHALEVKLLKAKVNELIGEKENLKNKIIDLEHTIVSWEARVDDRESKISDLEDEKKELNWKMGCMEKEFQLARDKAINALRLEMQEKLITSDLIRTEAIAKLAVYEKTDNKADSNAIKEMMKQLIDKVSTGTVSLVK